MELAALSRGKVGTNPMVGAVLVRDGKIIAEGWHNAFGNDHAERDLFNPSRRPACHGEEERTRVSDVSNHQAGLLRMTCIKNSGFRPKHGMKPDISISIFTPPEFRAPPLKNREKTAKTCLY